MDEQDNQYRECLKQFYSKLDLDDRYVRTLYMFCAHQNIEAMVSDLKDRQLYIDTYMRVKDFFDELITDYFEGLSTYSTKIRDENILLTNKQQLDKLKSCDFEVCVRDSPDRDNNFKPLSNQFCVQSYLNNCNVCERSLVLYFRRETLPESDLSVHLTQVDYFEFVLLVKVLVEYIKRNHSKLFNKVVITSREENIYPKYVHDVCDVSYTYNDFIPRCCVYSNTIYFVNGSVPDSAAGSIPVYCNNMLLQQSRSLEPHVHMDLTYHHDNYDDYVLTANGIMTIKEAFDSLPELRDTRHNIDHIMKEAIKTIDTLENIILTDLN